MGQRTWRTRRGCGAYNGAVSSTAREHDDTVPQGTTLLPRDLTPAQLKAAPVLASVDSLVIDELTDEEYDAFVAALRS